MIRLAPEAITPADFEALAGWLSTYPRLTQDRLVKEFEGRFADWLGRKHAVYVNSGSSANLLAIYALLESGRLKPGQEVAVPALSWSTDVAPLIQFGLKPVLVDCDLADLAMYPEGLKGTKAAILVSVLGLVPRMDRYDTPLLIEDCCESLGSTWHGMKLGTFGILSTFSFFYGHHMTTIEGGMVTTDNNDLANLLRQLRAHGWDRDTGGVPGSFNFVVPGFNLRNTEIGAWLGLRQLDRLDGIVTKRNQLFNKYSSLLGWPSQRLDTMVSAMAWPAIRKEPFIHHDVESRPLIAGNIARHPFWVDRYQPIDLPNADDLHDHAIYVPCHQDMTEADVVKIAGYLQ